MTRRHDLKGSWNAGLQALNAGLNEAIRIERQYRLIVDRMEASRRRAEKARDEVVIQQQKINQEQERVIAKVKQRSTLLSEYADMLKRTEAKAAKAGGIFGGGTASRQRIQSSLGLGRDLVEGRRDIYQDFFRAVRIIPGGGAAAFAGSYLKGIVDEVVKQQLKEQVDAIKLDLEGKLDNLRLDIAEELKRNTTFSETTTLALAVEDMERAQLLGRSWHRESDLSRPDFGEGGE